MLLIALKEIPNGTQPGSTFEATEAEGDVLILVGAAKRVDDPPAPPRAPRPYNRRNLTADA